jgi:hypothetical protein
MQVCRSHGGNRVSAGPGKTAEAWANRTQGAHTQGSCRLRAGPAGCRGVKACSGGVPRPSRGHQASLVRWAGLGCWTHALRRLRCRPCACHSAAEPGASTVRSAEPARTPRLPPRLAAAPPAPTTASVRPRWRSTPPLRCSAPLRPPPSVRPSRWSALRGPAQRRPRGRTQPPPGSAAARACCGRWARACATTRSRPTTPSPSWA